MRNKHCILPRCRVITGVWHIVITISTPGTTTTAYTVTHGASADD